MKIIFKNWKWNWKCALTPHDFHFVLKSNERFDYILNALREIPPRKTYVIYVSECVCVFVVHICNASYLKIEFLTRSLDGGRPTQRKTSMEICIFFTCKWYEGFFFYYLRSPDICMLENILTSPPASRTDSTKLTYSFLRLTSWHLKARECKVGDKKYLRNFEAITIEILGKVYTYIFSYD